VIPVVGLGTWKLLPPSLGPVIREAVKCGYHLFDGAAVYENEAELGKIFKDILNDKSLITQRGDVIQYEFKVSYRHNVVVYNLQTVDIQAWERGSAQGN